MNSTTPHDATLDTTPQDRWTAAQVAARLDKRRETPQGWQCCCPAHEDETPSLSLKDGDKGLVWKCHAGCDQRTVGEAIAARLGIAVSDLRPRASKTPRAIAETYDYTDAHGALVSQTVRYTPKGFSQRRPDGYGGWIWNLKGITTVLYRLPEVLTAVAAGETIYVAEGEKAVKRLWEAGLPATCSPMGAGKWGKKHSYNASLKGATVVLLPDNDDNGRAHVEKVRQALHGHASRIAILDLPDLPEKGDVYHWLAHGHTGEELRALAQAQLDAQQRQNGPPSVVPQTPLWYRVPYSDTSNATELCTHHGKGLTYCATWDRWFLWTGAYWRWDETLEVTHLARQTLKVVGQEAVRQENTDLIRHIAKSFSAGAINAMVEQLRSFPEVARRADAFDTHPWLLTCRNGTLDLRTGALLPTDPAHLITKCVPVAYDATATCPQWEAFLWQIMGGPEADTPEDSIGELEQKQTARTKAVALVTFLQRAFGMSLSGHVLEKALFLCHGKTGDNGKSTLLETVGKVLGSDYAKSPPMDIRLAGKDKEPETAIAALRGVRFAWNMEPDEGRRLSLNTLKKLSGGDTLTGRYLYGHHFTFQPEATLFLGANNRPKAASEDAAFWKRLKLIPFDVTIPKDKQDKELPARLVREEAAGILAWLVRGCLDWQRDGLGEPAAVTTATQEYRGENDAVQTFLDECCFIEATAKCKTGRLYDAYRKWSPAPHPLSLNKFVDALREKGFERGPRETTGVFYQGVGLYTTTTTEE